MSVWRKVAIAVFVLLTLACIAYLALLWLSLNLLTFPCDSLEDPRPCSEVIPMTFALQGLLPVGMAESLAAWLTFRRWGKY